MKFVDFPHEDTFDYSLERRCKNCQQVFTGRYCNRCGEKVIVPEDRSLPILFKKTFRTIPILDNRFVRTLRFMLLQTGAVARSYIDGRRRPFLDPLAIFLVVNFIYFLFPANQSFHIPLRTQMHFLMHSETATRLVEDRIQRDEITLEEFTIRYDQHAISVAKMMLVGIVLLMAGVFWLAHYSTGLFFRDHLIVSLEFCSVMLLLNNIVIPWIWIGVATLFSDGPVEAEVLFDNVFPVITMSIVSAFLFFQIERRVYGNKGKLAAVYSALLLAGLFVATHFYYGVVFFVSMWTL